MRATYLDVSFSTVSDGKLKPIVSMELLLNLASLALALLSFTVFKRPKAPAWHSRGSHQTSLLALLCAQVLLFPVISASDNLHPTQAVLEDDTKRVQQIVTPRQHESFGSSPSTVPALLALYLLAALVMLATCGRLCLRLA